MTEFRDLKEWSAHVVARAFTAAKLAETAEKFERDHPRAPSSDRGDV